MALFEPSRARKPSTRNMTPISTLHFYESKGLIQSWRTAGNPRRYSRDVLRRIGFIRVSQQMGIPLAAIREALQQLPNSRTPNEDDWARLARTWRDDLDGRASN